MIDVEEKKSKNEKAKKGTTNVFRSRRQLLVIRNCSSLDIPRKILAISIGSTKSLSLEPGTI